MFLGRAVAPSRKTAQPPRRSRQAGFLTFSGILMLLVITAIIFLAFKLLPPYINNYQMQDFLEGMTRNATYNRQSEDDLRKQVMDEARQLNIPVDSRQVQIQQAGTSVSIAMQYSITVDLLFRQLDLEFAPSAGNRNIMAKP